MCHLVVSMYVNPTCTSLGPCSHANIQRGNHALCRCRHRGISCMSRCPCISCVLPHIGTNLEACLGAHAQGHPAMSCTTHGCLESLQHTLLSMGHLVAMYVNPTCTSTSLGSCPRASIRRESHTLCHCGHKAHHACMPSFFPRGHMGPPSHGTNASN